MANKLTDKQEIFCNEFVKDRNATRSAKAAGYSDKTAHTTGSENLTKPEILERIIELAGDVCAEAKTDAVWMLKTLRECWEASIDQIMDENGTMLPVEQWPEIWKKLVSSMTVEEQFQDGVKTGCIKKIDILKGKGQILKMIGDHVDVSAFQANLKVTIEDKTADRLSAAKRRQQASIPSEN